MSTLGERLKQARKQQRMTQQELADRVGTSQSCINDIENERHQSSRYLSAIADVLQVDYRWLERGRGEPDSNCVARVPMSCSHGYTAQSNIQVNQRIRQYKYDIMVEGPLGSRHLPLTSDELELLRRVLMDM